MRTVLVAPSVWLALCAGCTYGIPNLARPADGGVDPAEASDEAGGDDGDGGDSGGGHQGDSGNGDAACTNGGVLCSCSKPSDCSSGICAQSVDVGADLGHAGFCTEPCCTSADCSSGSVCFASGQGGNYCVDPGWLGRSTPASSALGGASCTAGTECRSGLCLTGAGNVCADTCCSFGASSGECASGSQCAFGFFQGSGPDTHFAARCGPPGGSGTAGSPCAVSSECAGGLCYTSASNPYCVQPCSTWQECGSGSACQLDVQGTDLYAACFPVPGGDAEGASCDNYQQCLGGLCNAGSCTNICFSDAACTVTGWRCVPQQDDSYPPGNYTVLGCGP